MKPAYEEPGRGSSPRMISARFLPGGRRATSNLAAAIILILSVLIGFDGALAAGLPPLVEVTPIGGQKIFFDPDKISAVYQSPLIDIAERKRPAISKVLKHPTKTYVLGLRNLPSPVEADPKSLLDSLGISPKFVHLHIVTGDLYMKATTVAWITAASGHIVDKRVRSFVYPGLTSNGGNKIPWQVFESPDEVTNLVDKIRTHQDSE
jgi:hypothetical protein